MGKINPPSWWPSSAPRLNYGMCTDSPSSYLPIHAPILLVFEGVIILDQLINLIELNWHSIWPTPPPCFSRHWSFSSNAVLSAFSNMECIKRKPINKCLHMLVRKKADTSDWSICQQEGAGTGKNEGSRILRVRASPRSRCSTWTDRGKCSGLV